MDWFEKVMKRVFPSMRTDALRVLGEEGEDEIEELEALRQRRKARTGGMLLKASNKPPKKRRQPRAFAEIFAEIHADEEQRKLDVLEEEILGDDEQVEEWRRIWQEQPERHVRVWDTPS